MKKQLIYFELLFFSGETQSRVHLFGIRLACGTCGKVLPELVP